MMSEHCVRHCTLIMVCSIVLGKAKTTKVGRVWYELNIVNQSMNQVGRYRAARAAKNYTPHNFQDGKMVSSFLFVKTLSV